MNKAKLSALCAKARKYNFYILNFGSVQTCHVRELNHGGWQPEYNPLDDANQADDLLEYVADGREITTRSAPKRKLHQVSMWEYLHLVATATSENNLREAKILCALRASPEVTDAEINDAMEGE